MELAALKEKTWLEATSMLEDMKSISTLKKRAAAEILNVTNETILLKLKDRDEPLDIKQKHFNNAIDKIHMEGRVRQKFIDSYRADKFYPSCPCFPILKWT